MSSAGDIKVTHSIVVIWVKIVKTEKNNRNTTSPAN